MSSPSSAGTSSIVTGGTDAATRHPRSVASNSVIARVPLQPRLMHSQNRSRPTPKGETAPMPVMTILGESAKAIVTFIVIRMFAWVGGAVFVSSLLFLVFWYFVLLGRTTIGAGSSAFVFDTLLITVFASHHSLFARQAI